MDAQDYEAVALKLVLELASACRFTGLMDAAEELLQSRPEASKMLPGSVVSRYYSLTTVDRALSRYIYDYSLQVIAEHLATGAYGLDENLNVHLGEMILRTRQQQCLEHLLHFPPEEQRTADHVRHREHVPTYREDQDTNDHDMRPIFTTAQVERFCTAIKNFLPPETPYEEANSTEYANMRSPLIVLQDALTSSPFWREYSAPSAPLHPPRSWDKTIEEWHVGRQLWQESAHNALSNALKDIPKHNQYTSMIKSFCVQVEKRLPEPFLLSIETSKYDVDNVLGESIDITGSLLTDGAMFSPPQQHRHPLATPGTQPRRSASKRPTIPTAAGAARAAAARIAEQDQLEAQRYADSYTMDELLGAFGSTAQDVLDGKKQMETDVSIHMQPTQPGETMIEPPKPKRGRPPLRKNTRTKNVNSSSIDQDFVLPTNGKKQQPTTVHTTSHVGQTNTTGSNDQESNLSRHKTTVKDTNTPQLLNTNASKSLVADLVDGLRDVQPHPSQRPSRKASMHAVTAWMAEQENLEEDELLDETRKSAQQARSKHVSNHTQDLSGFATQEFEGGISQLETTQSITNEIEDAKSKKRRLNAQHETATSLQFDEDETSTPIRQAHDAISRAEGATEHHYPALTSSPAPKLTEKSSRQGIQRRRWTQEETMLLIQGIQEYGIRQWADIARYKFGNARDKVSVKDRFRTLLRQGVIDERGNTTM